MVLLLCVARTLCGKTTLRLRPCSVLQVHRVSYLKSLALPTHTERLQHYWTLKDKSLQKFSILTFSYVCSQLSSGRMQVHINHRLFRVIQICSVAINHCGGTSGRSGATHRSMNTLSSLTYYVSILRINTGYHIVSYLKRSKM